ncbi:hypothetical protein DAEQUDRAFT_579469 [Daedalea quercina L-15889]|uniref:Uncharacterized protein n=1 Tax=Daedalea quercina L-15889 TaxID=1314783 RepID=A0A165LUC4_9APHY|nr:hypothetical protein DAEQUDRAFT_579469 [Daedalea quercina L-15889]
MLSTLMLTIMYARLRGLHAPDRSAVGWRLKTLRREVKAAMCDEPTYLQMAIGAWEHSGQMIPCREHSSRMWPPTRTKTTSRSK